MNNYRNYDICHVFNLKSNYKNNKHSFRFHLIRSWGLIEKPLRNDFHSAKVTLTILNSFRFWETFRSVQMGVPVVMTTAALQGFPPPQVVRSRWAWSPAWCPTGRSRPPAPSARGDWRPSRGTRTTAGWTSRARPTPGRPPPTAAPSGFRWRLDGGAAPPSVRRRLPKTLFVRLQVDLESPKKITGIVTQGAKDFGSVQFVSAFKVAYGDDGRSWTAVKDDTTGTDKVGLGPEPDLSGCSNPWRHLNVRWTLKEGFFSGRTQNSVRVVCDGTQPDKEQKFKTWNLKLKKWHNENIVKSEKWKWTIFKKFWFISKFYLNEKKYWFIFNLNAFSFKMFFFSVQFYNFSFSFTINFFNQLMSVLAHVWLHTFPINLKT